ncbi:putative baseplate assembly protein [Natrarchaeobius halalkaliphilus]|uniref:Putative baseplate assembly protein n=1 Tax=Natrarchaeobius halalkaliphilus TaxID=1679091 RepID=A0A3N6LJC1_9EURY|nr:putative baseplate assembly protein [Natrarchaeobius halalkaliphilus]RQG88001.1 putative baseplate assembly protein [Natrarchaeobius halalkaliphilus]
MVEIPDLDDREFEDVLSEAKRQLPIYTDEWTDHNAHDSGIAILELLTWLAESYTYQLNRVTDEHREKYLRLLGVKRRLPTSARVRVGVEPPSGADGQTIPAGATLVADDGSGDVKAFETVSPTTITEATIDKIVTYAGGDIVNTTAEATTGETRFQAFGDDPSVGDALYVGFDGDPFADAQTLTLTFDLYDDDLPQPASHGEMEGSFDPSVELVWEFPKAYERWTDDDAWESLSVLEDGANAFYDGGDVVLERPPDGANRTRQRDPIGILEQDQGLYWIRCRILRSGYEFPPQFDTVRLNMLEVSHRNTVENEVLERTDGSIETTYESNQEFFFQNAPVLNAEIDVDGERWTEIDDLDRSNSLGTHYVLDHMRGSIRFGDGENGRKPPVRARVVATEYVHGGGTEGNVSANSRWEFLREDARLGETPLPEVTLTPNGPADGGRDMEPIDDAIDRFKRDFKRPYRAATLDDFVYVATHTPGLRFGRAHATATERTVDGRDYREIDVVVVPYSRQTRPKPSEGFVDAVQTHLDRTRLVTDVVSVSEPTYVDVDVNVVVSALSGYTDAELTAAITETLLTFLHPIEAGGWPFGHPLYISDVVDIIEDLPGIGAVETVSVTARGERRINEYGDVLIDDSALFALTERNVRVTIGE